LHLVTEPKVVARLARHQTVLGLALVHEVVLHGTLGWLSIHWVNLGDAKRVKHIAVVFVVPKVGEPVLCILTWVQNLFSLLISHLYLRLGFLLVNFFFWRVVKFTVCQDCVGRHWDF